MQRKTLDYSATRNTDGRRRVLQVIAAASAFVLCAATLVMWVRSYVTGDYVYLGKIHLSFARGYCRVVNAPWPFVPGYPVVGRPFVTYPLDKVGEYPMGSGASYVPLSLLALIFVVIGVWPSNAETFAANRPPHNPPMQWTEPAVKLLFIRVPARRRLGR